MKFTTATIVLAQALAAYAAAIRKSPNHLYRAFLDVG